MDQPPGLADVTAPPLNPDTVLTGPGIATGRAALIEQALAELHGRFRPLTAGKVADYIPELANADPDHFGICIATADGAVYAIGHADEPFTIQSVSKAFVYGLALEEHGRDAVLARVGVEPSGEPFNAIEFDQRTNRPFNPMVNAGAIATTALIGGATPAARLERLRSLFARYCGRAPALDGRVFASERETGHRNRAIAYLMLNAQMIEEPIAEHLDLYFQQCSLLVTARDLAIMAATLAAGGVNPLTGERALAEEHVRHVVAVMNSCGMYDYSGEWGFRVGLPAKSGVGGGIVAVLPGQLGIGVYSPPLDSNGNSVRGLAVCEELSRRFGLHLFDAQTLPGEVVRRTLSGDVIRSNRVRDPKTTAALDAAGRCIRVVQLQGSLYFAAVERLLRSLDADPEPLRHLILDLRHVGHIDGPAARLLADLAAACAREGRSLLICLPAGRNDVTALMTRAGLAQSQFCTDLDAALERVEDRLLAETSGAAPADATFDLGSLGLFAGLATDDLAVLAGAAERVTYPAGAVILREGDAADRVFLLLKGSVSARLDLGDGRSKRLATMDAGVTFGEMALLSGSARSADVIAETPVDCAVIGLAAIAELASSRPALHATLLANLGRLLAERLNRANREIRMLEP